MALKKGWHFKKTYLHFVQETQIIGLNAKVNRSNFGVQLKPLVEQNRLKQIGNHMLTFFQICKWGSKPILINFHIAS